MYAVRPDSKIVLAAGLRSPFVRAGGVFARENSAHLGARVARELLARCDLNPAELDEVIVGCVGPAFDQANVGRVLALRAGVPQRVPARTVARNCASGIEAVTTAAAEIQAGHGELYLCVGVEVMSAYPLAFGREMTDFFGRLSRAKSLLQRAKLVAGFRPRFLAPRVALTEGLTDPTCGLIMGKTAELLMREFQVSREQADRFALQSHERAKAARESGRLAQEILPHLPLEAARAEDEVAHDDGIRDTQTSEALAKLKPYFEKPDGGVTVGNSCGISDGACALLVTTQERAQALGLSPLALLKGWAWAGLEPARMGLGPVMASGALLGELELELADMDVIEINEAFAAQVLACREAFASEAFARKELGRSSRLGELDLERTNVNGGAIALGHPVGATGARLLLTLAHELLRREKPLGLATLCIGGGQGGAVVLERGGA